LLSYPLPLDFSQCIYTHVATHLRQETIRSHRQNVATTAETTEDEGSLLPIPMGRPLCWYSPYSSYSRIPWYSANQLLNALRTFPHTYCMPHSAEAKVRGSNKTCGSSAGGCNFCDACCTRYCNCLESVATLVASGWCSMGWC